MKKDKNSEERYLKLRNKIEDLVYFESNREYLIKNIELFQELIMDGYANEKRIKEKKIEVYEFAIEAIRNLRKYLVESNSKYQKHLEIAKLELLELNELKE